MSIFRIKIKAQKGQNLVLLMNQSLVDKIASAAYCVQLSVMESVRHIPLSVLRPTNFQLIAGLEK